MSTLFDRYRGADMARRPLTTWRCASCGQIPAYHIQEPVYFGAERLEPGLTHSIAGLRGCQGYEGVEITLAYARASGPWGLFSGAANFV